MENHGSSSRRWIKKFSSVLDLDIFKHSRLLSSSIRDGNADRVKFFVDKIVDKNMQLSKTVRIKHLFEAIHYSSRDAFSSQFIYDIVSYLARNLVPDVLNDVMSDESSPYFGNTPLHFAVIIANVHAVYALLENGSDPYALNCFDCTPSDYANNITDSSVRDYVRDLLDKYGEISVNHDCLMAVQINRINQFITSCLGVSK